MCVCMFFVNLCDCVPGNGKVSGGAAAEGSFTALTGLLEVEPLHFSCISTSDGTRVERDDASMFTGQLHTLKSLSCLVRRLSSAHSWRFLQISTQTGP